MRNSIQPPLTQKSNSHAKLSNTIFLHILNVKVYMRKRYCIGLRVLEILPPPHTHIDYATYGGLVAPKKKEKKIAFKLDCT